MLVETLMFTLEDISEVNVETVSRLVQDDPSLNRPFPKSIPIPDSVRTKWLRDMHRSEDGRSIRPCTLLPGRSCSAEAVLAPQGRTL